MPKQTKPMIIPFDDILDAHNLFVRLDTLYDLPNPTKYYEYLGTGEWLYNLSEDDALILFLLICESENIGE